MDHSVLNYTMFINSFLALTLNYPAYERQSEQIGNLHWAQEL